MSKVVGFKAKACGFLILFSLILNGSQSKTLDCATYFVSEQRSQFSNMHHSDSFVGTVEKVELGRWFNRPYCRCISRVTPLDSQNTTWIWVFEPEVFRHVSPLRWFSRHSSPFPTSNEGRGTPTFQSAVGGGGSPTWAKIRAAVQQACHPVYLSMGQNPQLRMMGLVSVCSLRLAAGTGSCTYRRLLRMPSKVQTLPSDLNVCIYIYIYFIYLFIYEISF